MSNFDSPGAAVPPAPVVPVVTTEPTGQSGLRQPVRIFFGRSFVDKMTDYVGTPLHKISPLFGHAYDNSAQLRTLFGNSWLLFPAAGAYLGGWAVRDTHGLAIPPVLWLTIAIMVLGILDAFSGLVATLVFAGGVIATGHLFSTHWLAGPAGTQGMLYAFTGLLTMAFLWFIGPQLPRRVRLLGFNAIKSKFQRRYTIGGDFIIITLLMLLVLGALPIFVPLFTGADKQSLTQVTLQNHIDIIKWVVGFTAVLRVLIDSVVHAKFELITKTTGRERGPVTHWILRILGSLIAFALVWEVVGTTWQWPVIWVLLVSLDLLSAIGERFLKPSAIYRYVPRNLFRIVTLLLLCQYGARVLSGQVITGIELIGWLVLLLAVAISIYAILDGPEDEEDGDRSATWLTRLIGMIVVVALFVLSQGFIGISATPYSNPTAIAVGANGALYIADAGNNRVIEVAPDGTRYQVGTGISNPGGVAADPTTSPSAIYISDTGHDQVLRVALTPRQALLLPGRHGTVATADGPTSQTSVATGLSHPTGLSTDVTGRLFIADTGHDRIIEVRTNGTQFVFARGLSGPLAVSADVFGHLFVANTGAGDILRYNVAKNGTNKGHMIFASRLTRPAGVAADAQGNLFVTDTGANLVYEYQSNHHRVTVPGDFLDPRGIAVDGAGHLYVTNAGRGTVILSEPIYVDHTNNFGPSSVATAVARAHDGSYFVVDANAGTLEHVMANETILLTKGLNLPSGVAVSALGKLFVSQAGNGTILQVNPMTGVATIVTQGLTGVTAITPDPFGGLFAIATTQGKLYAVDAQGRSHLLYSGLATPTSVVQDAYDYIDVTLLGHSTHSGSVWRIVPGGKAEILATGLNSPGNITADFNGDVFFIEHGTHRVWEDRGLLGAQIIWTGTGARTNPSTISSDLNGNVTVFPTVPHHTIELRSSSTVYEI